MTDEDWESGFAKSVAVYLNGQGIPDLDVRGQRVTDDSFVLCFNAHHEPIEFTLPPKEFGPAWVPVIYTADTATAEEAKPVTRGRQGGRRCARGDGAAGRRVTSRHSTTGNIESPSSGCRRSARCRGRGLPGRRGRARRRTVTRCRRRSRRRPRPHRTAPVPRRPASRRAIHRRALRRPVGRGPAVRRVDDLVAVVVADLVGV